MPATRKAVAWKSYKELVQPENRELKYHSASLEQIQNEINRIQSGTGPSNDSPKIGDDITDEQFIEMASTWNPFNSNSDEPSTNHLLPGDLEQKESPLEILENELASGPLQVPRNRQRLIDRIRRRWFNVDQEKDFMMVRIGNREFTVSENIMKVIDTYIRGYETGLLEGVQGSDIELGTVIMHMNPNIPLEINVYPKTNQNKQRNTRKRQGGFIPYTMISNALPSMKRYGIYNKFDEKNYKVNCLIKAIANHGPQTKTICDELKVMLRKRVIAQKHLKCLAKKCNFKLTVSSLKKKNGKLEKQKKVYKPSSITENTQHFEICLVADHYAIMENHPTFTKYATKHYSKLKHLEEWYNYSTNNHGKLGIYENSAKANTLEILKFIMDHKEEFLTKFTFENMLKLNFEQVQDIHECNLEVTETNCRLMVDPSDKPSKEKQHPPTTFFVDLETATDKEGIMEAYQLGFVKVDEQRSVVAEGCITSPNCIHEFQDQYLNQDSRIIIHNLSFDMTWLMRKFKNTVSVPSNIQKSENKITSMVLKLADGTMLHFQDSLSLIPSKLANFPKMFGLDNIEKEVMPYKLYNHKTIQKKSMSIYKAMEILEKDGQDIDQFLKNIREWDCMVGYLRFDHLKYSAKYCLLDCQILHKGYEQFRKDIGEDFGLCLDDFVTMPHLAHTYMKKKGVYDDVYEFSGVLRKFMQQQIVGGRTCSRKNEKHRIEESIVDLDINSMYPAAMATIGLPKGKPVVFNESVSIDTLQTMDYWIAEGYITNIQNHYSIPQLSYKNEKGIRVWSDTLEEFQNKKITINKIDFENWSKHSGITFKIHRGLYWNQGLNKTIQDVITDMYDMRKKLKKEKNTKQLIYKLAMNASYGRTIQKPIDNEYVYKFGEEEAMQYLRLNHNIIKCKTKLHDCDIYKFKVTNPIDEHYSSPHVGGMVLSESKRLMDNVICPVELNHGASAIYTDTDSIIIQKKHQHLFEQTFEENYPSQKLMGNALGQFSSDFKDGIECTRMTVLGKKAYLCEMNDGSNHIRMKGVSSKAIEYKAKELECSVSDIYKDLYNGKEVEFDLAKGGLILDFNSNMQVSVKSEFIRKVSF